MVEGLHINIQNRTIKSFAIALSGAGRRLKKGNSGSNLTNVQYKLFRIVTMNPPCTMNIS
jgi:hypothetical protein